MQGWIKLVFIHRKRKEPTKILKLQPIRLEEINFHIEPMKYASESTNIIKYAFRKIIYMLYTVLYIQSLILRRMIKFYFHTNSILMTKI